MSIYSTSKNSKKCHISIERVLPYEIHRLRKTPQHIDATHRSFTYGEFSIRKKN